MACMVPLRQGLSAPPAANAADTKDMARRAAPAVLRTLSVMSLLGRTWFVMALASIAFTGCGQREGGAPVQPGADDGRVVEASGTVTATRGGQTRPLAV